jgi:hypothetical protein
MVYLCGLELVEKFIDCESLIVWDSMIVTTLISQTLRPRHVVGFGSLMITIGWLWLVSTHLVHNLLKL